MLVARLFVSLIGIALASFGGLLLFEMGINPRRVIIIAAGVVVAAMAWVSPSESPRPWNRD